MDSSLKPLDYDLSHEGDRILIRGDGDEFFLHLSDPHLVDRRSGVFAAWILLPLAMIKNRSIRIHGGTGDDLVSQNFETLSLIWSTWMPDKFHRVSVAFDESGPTLPPETSTDLVLFSGGVDSTYNLLMRHRAGLKQTFLTIHGMDYREADRERFDHLVAMTRPLIALTSSNQIFCRTNAYTIYRKYGLQASISHAFLLFGCLFLHGASYRRGEIAADNARYQEFLLFPWGTNSVTNPLFESRSFKIHTANLDQTRAEKLGLITAYPEALSALSFCVNYDFRPKNCGVCPKCIRTKMMFVAECGAVPDIFADPSLRKEHFALFNLTQAASRKMLLDIAQRATLHGYVDRLPGLAEMIAKLQQPPRPELRACLQMFRDWLRSRLK